jgi:signal transduction histidine kinase
VADFLSVLVHELRTPLTALRGSLGLLAAEAETAGADLQEYSAIAVRNAAKLVILLDDLGSYARLRNPEFCLKRASVDLSALLEDAAERVQAVAEKRGVTLRAELAPFNVNADGTELCEAVARMAFYAVRVTPKDGEVRISAETVAGQVVIRVADQGKPLLEEHFCAVFEPFSRTAQRGVDSAARAGLDLAIAKTIAELHDGAIEYRQITGGGVVRLTVGNAPQ